MTNPRKTTFYVGVTNNIVRRSLEHYNGRHDDSHFTGKYNCHKLIYYEQIESIIAAIAREKELKTWTRKKKIDLIKSKNPSMAFYRLSYSNFNINATKKT